MVQESGPLCAGLLPSYTGSFGQLLYIRSQIFEPFMGYCYIVIEVPISSVEVTTSSVKRLKAPKLATSHKTLQQYKSLANAMILLALCSWNYLICCVLQDYIWTLD